MKKLLHIIATPRGADSRTLKLSRAFLNGFESSHEGWVVDELNLFTEELPELTVKRVDGKYILIGGKDLFGEAKEAWTDIISNIDRFMSADAYLLSTPMWNFSIPYKLKQYIDIIVQPKYLFRYTPDGSVEGLIKDKRMAVVASRGGEYIDAPMSAMDHQEPYLRSIFGFCGLTEIDFVVAQPMDMGREVQLSRLEEACSGAEALGRGFLMRQAV